MSDDAAQSAHLTALLRTGDDPFWIRLRELLRERGLDPEELELVESQEEGERYEFGIVVTPEGHRFQYTIYYGETPLEQAEFQEWNRA
jgi:hypothetical protein